MKGFTSPEQAQMQQAKYRMSCQYARRGHVVFNAKNGQLKEIHQTFTREVENLNIPAMNAARKWVRENAATQTFVV